MSQVPANCPHFGGNQASPGEIKDAEKQVKSCWYCEYAGPNLWICMQRKCLRVGCSEQANDHSTEHFQRNNLHCLHMNLSSRRIWCYMCEREVFFLGATKQQMSEPLSTTTRTASLFSAKHNDDSDDAESAATTASTTGLVGLQNIANTCYMNSALQALSNVQQMTNFFLHCGDLVDHTVKLNAHRNKADLAKSYQRLMQDIWKENSEPKDYVAPRGILHGIRSVHPMFRGFQEHDTQEFLRCFMDQLHEELKEQTPSPPFLSDSKSNTSEKPQYESMEDDELINSDTNFSNSSSGSDTEYETCESDAEQSGQSQLNLGQTRSNRRRQRNSNCGTASQPSTQSSVRSIISDIFDGKLLSSVQCLTCDRVSTREETFQDLSLPIPNRDYLNVLHQTHSLSAQSLNSIDTTAGREGDSWLSWIWQSLRSWLWGPSVTLHDCMASFFSADELKGDNMYSCEKCNKLRTGVKYSKILDLPEVLCIHLKRFRHDLVYSSKISSYVQFPLQGFDMRPYLHKACKSHIAQYNLVSVICHHGTVGGGHYTCYARNEFTNRWYEYDDHHVKEVQPDAVQNCQAYVLFYSKHNPQMELVRSKANELSATNPVHLSHIRFFVAREWISRFNTFAEPGPINNWAILCPHGGLLQSKMSVLGQVAVPIAQPLWDHFYRTFGGGPAINMLFECKVCKQAVEALARRQFYELDLFTKYNELDANVGSNAIFAISMPWLRKWQQFVRGISHREPGPITNATIANASDLAQVSSTSTPISSVRLGSDYAQVNAPLWRFLHGIYGGGPEIMLRGFLKEEIEIIDQDDADSDMGRSKLDISDTESNIDNGSTVILNQSEPIVGNESAEELEEEINESTELSKVDSTISKDSAHSIHKNHKKSRISALRTNFRKKTLKGRNAMKKSDFFGPKGHYSKSNSVDSIDVSETVHDVERPRSAFQKKTKSFQYDRNQRNVYAVKSREDHKAKSKAKDVVLEKCLKLPESENEEPIWSENIRPLRSS